MKMILPWCLLQQDTLDIRMQVLVIGSGGREHALAWKSAQDESVSKVFVCPGNAGTALENKLSNISININDFNAIENFCIEENIDLVIIGPEQPLVDGLVNFLNEKKVRVFGPDKFASQLEGSKAFTKNLCKKNNIPTANFGIFNNYDDASTFIKKNGTPMVIKADGLAAGKGVSVCTSIEEALKNTKEILDGKFKSSNKVV